MKLTHIAPCALIASFGLLITDATAKPKHAQDKGKGNQSNADKGHKGKDHKVDKANKAHKKHKHDKHAKFEDNDRKAILNIFRAPDGRQQLPPGLAKNLKRGKPLPPGWQKKLNPDYRIENEIWNAFTPISYDMVPNAKRHPNAQLYYHDNKVYRVLNATREILDVMSVK